MTPSQAIRRMGIVAARLDGLPDMLCVPLDLSEYARQFVGPIDPFEGGAGNEERA